MLRQKRAQIKPFCLKPSPRIAISIILRRLSDRTIDREEGLIGRARPNGRMKRPGHHEPPNAPPVSRKSAPARRALKIFSSPTRSRSDAGRFRFARRSPGELLFRRSDPPGSRPRFDRAGASLNHRLIGVAVEKRRLKSFELYPCFKESSQRFWGRRRGLDLVQNPILSTMSLSDKTICALFKNSCPSGRGMLA